MENAGIRKIKTFAALGVLSFLLAGCGDGGLGSVEGTVTYQGTPLDDGYVSFMPADEGGTGPTFGAKITNGKYQASGLTPGKARIIVTAAGAAADATPKTSAPSTKAEAVSLKRAIPPNAAGNNIEQTITPGSQTVNFDLQMPKR